MSVVIMGMEMPESCFQCKMRRKVDPDTLVCLITGKMFEETFSGTIERRCKTCPLRPLPDAHGDLIDRDALPSRVEWEDIVSAPAIVGAEGKEPIKITGKIYFVDGHVYIDPDEVKV